MNEKEEGNWTTAKKKCREKTLGGLAISGREGMTKRDSPEETSR